MLPTREELVRFVEESNAIEGIYDQPGERLFDNHLAVAELIVEQAPHGYLTCKDIHSLLLRGVDVFRGTYRTGDVHIQVDKCRVQHFPNAFWVEQSLMPEYEYLVYQARLKAVPGIVPREYREVLAKTLHDHGLSIHPFHDGNGRTFRLQWNQLRLAFGLPWITVHREQQEEYRQSVREYEKNFFEVEYAHAY